MDWVHDLIKVGLGALLGIGLGTWIAVRRRENEKLFQCYANYFDRVLGVAVEIDGEVARAAFLELSHSAREIELLESDAGCVMSTGLLFARCSTLVETLADASVATSPEVSLIRRQISEEYSAALRVVRRRLGSSRELSWRTSVFTNPSVTESSTGRR